MKKTKTLKERGITLIALVITIIVLLILAGVSIAMLTGQNGILTQANNAKIKNDQSSLNEEIGLAVQTDRINKETGEEGSLEEELNKIEGATVEKISEGEYYVERNGYGVTVNEEGKIEEGTLSIWDGTTKEKPETDAQGNWHIYNASQMKFFADYCNNVLTEEEKATMPEITESTTVYLENNIDMGARQENGILTSGVAWTPVMMTTGIFDGKEHSVSGIYVNSSVFAGLFSGVGEIKNVTIKNSYIETMMVGGGIVGLPVNSSGNISISDCHNVNTIVKGASGNTCYVGGIVGMTSLKAKVTSCTNSGNITGTLAGGITGTTGGIGSGSNEPITIENCSNYGNVNGTTCAGGILGSVNDDQSTITNSYNSGEISGTSEVGGILGRSQPSIIVSNCYNKGNVIGGTDMGAIIGKQYENVNENSSNLYYLNTLPIKAINGVDYEDKNIKEISEEFNSREEFIEWLNQ